MSMNTLLELDARWSSKLRIAERPGILRTLAAVFAHSGDSWFCAIALAIVWWFGDTHWKAWSIKILGAIVITAVLVMTLKLVFRRRRPEGHWGGIYRSTDPHSFPSGHAARAALMAALITAWGPAWLVPIALVWAPLVALARVAMGVHYVSDVVFGALLGLSVATLALVLMA
jgi:undecaprenyl-diphosphatase